MAAENVTPLHPLRSINPGRWQGRRPPERDWLIEGVAIRKTVCLFNGPGSSGKSLLMLQLQAAAALGLPWLGRDCKRVRSFGLYAEDPEDEVWRRMSDVARYYGAEFGDLAEDVEILPADMMDQGPTLYRTARRDQVGSMTPLWGQISRFCRDEGRELVILDNAAFVYHGDRIDEGQVVHFMDQLKQLAVAINGVVVLLQHPSASGMESKTGESGSRGWNNAARSRLFLNFPPENDDPENDPTNERVLRFMKANYGPRNKGLRIEWKDGVFEAVTVSDQKGGQLTPTDLIELNALVVNAIGKLMDEGERVTLKDRAPNHAASVLSRRPEFRKFTWKEIAGSVRFLLSRNRLAVIELGPATKKRGYVRPFDRQFPEERRPE